VATSGPSPRRSGGGERQGICFCHLGLCIPNPYSYSQAPEKVGLGVVDLANSTATSGAEVPIPVLRDVSNTASSQGAVDSPEISQKVAVPVISITKPPAPLPVDLPTHDEIIPASLDFESHPDDIESGGSLMREISHHSRDTTGSGSPRSSSSDPRSAQTTPPPPPSAPTSPLPRVANLLGDPEPSLIVSPIKPSASARSPPRATSPPLLLPIENTPLEEEGSDQEGEDLGTTIRLVVSRSEVGLALDQVQSDETDDTSSQADTAYDTASSLNGSSLPPSRASHSAQDLREEPGI
jgi:hypothetical protein